MGASQKTGANERLSNGQSLKNLSNKVMLYYNPNYKICESILKKYMI